MDELKPNLQPVMFMKSMGIMKIANIGLVSI